MKPKYSTHTILIIDYGSQYTQLIARQIRELNTFCQIVSHDISYLKIKEINPIGIILSGGPSSVYETDSPDIDNNIFDLSIPILGICYGAQLIAHKMGGLVQSSTLREYGKTLISPHNNSRLFKNTDDNFICWMSHGDSVKKLPPNFKAVASTDNTLFASFENENSHIYAIQFHPEVKHTQFGKQIIENFVVDICMSPKDYVVENFIEAAYENIKLQVKPNQMVLLALSGGVDSTTLAFLLNNCIGDNLICIFVDHGLLRYGEAENLREIFDKNFSGHVIMVDAQERFLQKLQGVIDPELKRKIIGNEFIEVFKSESAKITNAVYLAQGTLYPDVIESAANHHIHNQLKSSANKIKSHHNVGGLPENLPFDLIEPFNTLFKDEVRKIAKYLNVPEIIVNRHPFPGPGMAIRIIGDITREKILKVQMADMILQEEILKANLYDSLWQVFAVLVPVKSIGVMGDKRTYEEQIVLRAVTSDDGMTADWARLPYELLAKVSSRIVNEVKGINRVLYDITSKPPATIEWE